MNLMNCKCGEGQVLTFHPGLQFPLENSHCCVTCSKLPNFPQVWGSLRCKFWIRRESKRQKFVSCILLLALCGHAQFWAVFESTELYAHEGSVAVAGHGADSTDTCAPSLWAFGHALSGIWMSDGTSSPAWDGWEREQSERDRSELGEERLLQNWNEHGIFKMETSWSISVNTKQTRWTYYREFSIKGFQIFYTSSGTSAGPLNVLHQRA